jgi:uncharacterized protein YcnI
MLAASAEAHIQVSPSTAAPDDAVAFTLLVPGERDVATTEVRLQVPKGVLVFSYEDLPGWARSTKKAADGSVGEIVWKGRLAKDGFVRLGFLASTPPQPTTLSWKALQTYADGKVVRWIGAPGSEQPAGVTEVADTAAKQNAGGEGEGAREAEVRTGAPVVATQQDDDSPLALVLAIVGVELGGTSLALRVVKS